MKKRAPLIPSDHLVFVVRLARRTVRFWWVGAAILVVGIVATVAFARVQVKRYLSEAVVYYQEGLSWTANEGTSPRRIGQRLKDTLLARTQLAKVIEDLDLFPNALAAGKMSEAVEEMRARVGFKVTEGEIFVISYTGDSAAEAQRVAAKLTDVLIGENTRLRSEQAEVAKAFLDAEKKRNEAALQAKEGALLQFLAKHPEFAQEQTQSGVGAAVRATTKKGSEAQAAPRAGNALEALRREEERLRQRILNPNEIPRPAADPALVVAKNEAETKLRGAQRELTERRARYTEQHPDVRAAAAMVQEAEDAYKRAADAVKVAESTAAPAVTAESKAALQARLGQVRDEIAEYQRKHPREQGAPSEPVESSDTAQRIVAVEAEWARLNREVAEARERFQQLDTKQFITDMTATTLLSGQAAQIVVIDPAFLPGKPIGTSKQRLFLLGALASLALGLGLAVLCALLDDRVYDHADVDRLELAPLLIEVPGRSLREARPGGPAPRRGGALGRRLGLSPRTRQAISSSVPAAEAARQPQRREGAR
jgi:protein tyrosine kinase modulator